MRSLDETYWMSRGAGRNDLPISAPGQSTELRKLAPILQCDPTYAGICIPDTSRGEFKSLMSDLRASTPGLRIGVEHKSPVSRYTWSTYVEMRERVVRALSNSTTRKDFVRFESPFTFLTHPMIAMAGAAQLLDITEVDTTRLLLGPGTDWKSLKYVNEARKFPRVRRLELVAEASFCPVWSAITGLIKAMPNITTLHIQNPEMFEFIGELDVGNRQTQHYTKHLIVSLESPPTPGVLYLISKLKKLKYEVIIEIGLDVTIYNRASVKPSEVVRESDIISTDILSKCHTITITATYDITHDLSVILDYPTLRSIKLDAERTVATESMVKLVLMCLQPRQNIEVVEVGCLFHAWDIEENALTEAFYLIETHPALTDVVLRFRFHMQIKYGTREASIISILRNNPRLQTLHIPISLTGITPDSPLLDALEMSSVTSLTWKNGDRNVVSRVSRIICQNRRKAVLVPCYYSVMKLIGTHPLFEPYLIRVIGGLLCTRLVKMSDST
jgi:hypothetical protein